MSKMNWGNRFIHVKKERFGSNKLLFMAVKKPPLLHGLLCKEHEVRIVHYVEIGSMGCRKNLRMKESKEK